MRNGSIFRKVNLALMKGADRLTGEELVRITELAEPAGAVIYISIPSWQDLLAVPVTQQQQVVGNLRDRGYDSVRVTRKLDQRAILQLRGKKNALSPAYRPVVRLTDARVSV